MLSHYFKLARKALLKNRYYTFINVFGLVCGMLSGLIIAKYVGGSLQFDSFHVKKDRIYAIAQTESINGTVQKESTSTYWGAIDFIKQYPEVSQITRYSQHVEAVIQTDGTKGDKVSLVENKISVADSGFLNIFSFPLIFGDSATALTRINTLVLTQSASNRYFGNDNPIGEVLSVRVPWGENKYEITGVLQDLPQRSQFQFDFLLAAHRVDPAEFWIVPDCSIFVLLNQKSELTALQSKLVNTLDQVAPLKDTHRKVLMSLKSINKVDLTTTEYLLVAIGIFIILISWVNYINQIIVQSYLRTKEIGILRVLGSTSNNLKTQFVIESSILCLTSLFFVVGIYMAIEPYLQSFTHGHVLPLFNDPIWINPVFAGVFVLGIITAAFIPTLILFASDFASALRSGFGSKIESFGLRKALVVFQFSISTVMLISIFVINNQLDFMDHQDKGISMDNILIVKDPISTDTNWISKRTTRQLFMDQCAQLPYISEITSSTTFPGQEYRHEAYLSFQNPDKKALVHLTGVDDHFFDLYKVKFVAGHNFIPNARFQNRKSIILSESAARSLNITDIDKTTDYKITDHESDKEYNLIGIVQDYHQTSLKYEIKPMAFQFNEFIGHFSLRVNRVGLAENELHTKLDGIKKIWNQVYPNSVFDSFFLDEKFEAQDAEDHYFGMLFKCFTLLSIIISCLGLFGLSLMVSTKRHREIGVRKTFGATSVDILTLFLKGYFSTILISVLLGSPIAYLLMKMWLKNYSYRVDVGFWPTSLAVLSLTLIFLITVSYHTIKASLTNPVKILRD